MKAPVQQCKCNRRSKVRTRIIWQSRIYESLNILQKSSAGCVVWTCILYTTSNSSNEQFLNT